MSGPPSRLKPLSNISAASSALVEESQVPGHNLFANWRDRRANWQYIISLCLRILRGATQLGRFVDFITLYGQCQATVSYIYLRHTTYSHFLMDTLERFPIVPIVYRTVMEPTSLEFFLELFCRDGFIMSSVRNVGDFRGLLCPLHVWVVRIVGILVHFIPNYCRWQTLVDSWWDITWLEERMAT